MDPVRNLTILQNNINSIRPVANRSLLTHLLQLHKIDIAILSEIWLKPNEDFNFPGYKFYKKTRDKGYGGVALLIKKEIHFQEIKLPDLNPVEAIAIKTTNTVIPFLFISIYIPPSPINNNQIKKPLTDLFNFIDLNNCKAIIAGDFNAHHSVWNVANKTCPRGELILDLIENRNLIIMNDGTPTMIKHPNITPSAIDLTIVSSCLAPKVEWSVLDEEICGDHKIIIFKLINQAQKFEYNSSLINKKKAIKNINAVDPNLITSPEKLSDIFISNIDETKYKPNKRFTPKKWWNSHIQELYDDKTKKFINYLNNLTLDNLIIFKKARAILKTEIKKAKRKSFQDLTDTLTPDLNIKQLWTTVKMISGGFPQKNNLQLLNNKELGNKFMDLNFPPITNEIEYDVSNNPNLSSISVTDILNTFKSKKDSSSPGPDNISYYILKNLNTDLITVITKMCNEVLNNKNIPESWLTIKVVPILKPGKNEICHKSYRPICLIPTFLKTINIKIKSELVKFIQHNNILPQYSFGFKSKTSSINCVNYLVSKIENTKNNKQCIMVTFLDLSKAFDNIDISTLLTILKEKGFPAHLIDWLYFYLRKRKAILTLNDGTTIERTTNKGLPQGCPISPILFNIYTTKLHEITEDGTLIQFADDFAVVAIGTDAIETSNNMNTTLNTLCTQFETLGMQVNPEKSATIVFMNNIPENIDIKINNNEIEIKMAHKYLGIWIDYKLNFKTHITHTVNKAKKKINILKMLSRKKGGCHPKVLQRVNNSIVRSQIDYGLTVYSKACKTDLSRIEKAQNLSIRTSYRYLQSTPIHVIYAEAGELPLKYRSQYLTYKEILKTLYYDISPITNHIKDLIHSDELPKNHTFLEKIASLNNFHILQCKTQQHQTLVRNNTNNITIIPTIASLNRKNTPPALQKVTILKLIQDYIPYFKLYTDGSKTKDGVGYGIYDHENKISFSYKLNSNFTIMNAELVGIIEALEYAISIGQFKVVIFTDSQSGCMALIDKNYENYLVQQFYTLINYNSFQEVVIQWIPGHINIIGNDRADSAAKLGIHKAQTEHHPLTIGDSLINFKNELVTEWNTEYNRISTEKGKEHFQIMNTIETKPWYNKIDLTTTQTITIGRIRTFHTATKDRLYKWNLIRTENCELCGVQENLIHILYDCPGRSSIRNKYPVLRDSSDFIDILKNKNIVEYVQIADFVKETGTNV